MVLGLGISCYCVAMEKVSPAQCWVLCALVFAAVTGATGGISYALPRADTNTWDSLVHQLRNGTKAQKHNAAEGLAHLANGDKHNKHVIATAGSREDSSKRGSTCATIRALDQQVITSPDSARAAESSLGWDDVKYINCE